MIPEERRQYLVDGKMMWLMIKDYLVLDSIWESYLSTWFLRPRPPPVAKRDLEAHVDSE